MLLGIFIAAGIPAYNDGTFNIHIYNFVLKKITRFYFLFV